jgi:ComF family protein
MNNTVAQFRSYFDGVLSLAYPNICKGCSASLKGRQEILCRKCIANLPRTGFEWATDNPTNQSFWGRTPVVFAASGYYYRKGELLQTLIGMLKYKQRQDVGVFLGGLTGKLIQNSPFFETPDLIIPVPLHPRKFRLRGYNQCDYIAKGISAEIGVPVFDKVLMRDVYNPSQTKKTRFERWENVSGIFKVAQPELLIGKHILLVDDVITTGSTLEACCLPISQITGTKVSIVTVGYSVR